MLVCKYFNQKWLSCHVGCQEVSRGESEDSFACRWQSIQAKGWSLALRPRADLSKILDTVTPLATKKEPTNEKSLEWQALVMGTYIVCRGSSTADCMCTDKLKSSLEKLNFWVFSSSFSTIDFKICLYARRFDTSHYSHDIFWLHFANSSKLWENKMCQVNFIQVLCDQILFFFVATWINFNQVCQFTCNLPGCSPSHWFAEGNLRCVSAINN